MLVGSKIRNCKDSTERVKNENRAKKDLRICLTINCSDSLPVGIFRRIVFWLISSLWLTFFKFEALDVSAECSEFSGDELCSWLLWLLLLLETFRLTFWVEDCKFRLLFEFKGTMTVIICSWIFEGFRPNLGHLGWWAFILLGENVKFSALGSKPSFRCCRWHLDFTIYSKVRYELFRTNLNLFSGRSKNQNRSASRSWSKRKYIKENWDVNKGSNQSIVAFTN